MESTASLIVRCHCLNNFGFGHSLFVAYQTPKLRVFFSNSAHMHKKHFEASKSRLWSLNIKGVEKVWGFYSGDDESQVRGGESKFGQY